MTVLTGQALVYAACEPLRVFPSVAKEDLWSAKLRCLDPAFPRRPGARLLYGLVLSSDCRALSFLAAGDLLTGGAGQGVGVGGGRV